MHEQKIFKNKHLKDERNFEIQTFRVQIFQK